jgi:hypothetical protein
MSTTDPKHPEYVGEARPIIDLEHVARNMRMRTNYDARSDETHAMWQFGKYRYKATFSAMHRGLDALREWEAEQKVKAALDLLKQATEC